MTTAVKGKIFTLGGAEIPITEKTLNGEKHMVELEQEFAKKLGLEPSMRRSSYSKTINVEAGYTDVDEGF